MPHLQKLGEVDVFLSGRNHSLQPGFEVKYRSPGLSLFYSKEGGLDTWQMLKKNNIAKALRHASHLPLEKYDLVLNDFDFITAYSAKMKNLPSIQFGHQASFASPNTPRFMGNNFSGEFILNHFAPASSYVGLHIKRYDQFIFPPVIKESILHAEPCNLGHTVVYLPAITSKALLGVFSGFKDLQFVVFGSDIHQVSKSGNVTFQPINDHVFTSHLIKAESIITGGGFETPAEALYLGKKMLICPISRHYEQLCNAAALEKEGISVVQNISLHNLKITLNSWLYESPKECVIEANDISETFNHILSVNETLQKVKPLPSR